MAVPGRCNLDAYSATSTLIQLIIVFPTLLHYRKFIPLTPRARCDGPVNEVTGRRYRVRVRPPPDGCANSDNESSNHPKAVRAAETVSVELFELSELAMSLRALL